MSPRNCRAPSRSNWPSSKAPSSPPSRAPVRRGRPRSQPVLSWLGARAKMYTPTLLARHPHANRERGRDPSRCSLFRLKGRAKCTHPSSQKREAAIMAHDNATTMNYFYYLTTILMLLLYYPGMDEYISLGDAATILHDTDTSTSTIHFKYYTTNTTHYTILLRRRRLNIAKRDAAT